MNRKLLKEVIVSNEYYVNNIVGSIVEREGVVLPDLSKKLWSSME